jgi:hypothetical protein
MQKTFLLSKEILIRLLFLHSDIWFFNIHEVIILLVPMAGQIAFNNAFLFQLSEDLILEEVRVLVVVEVGIAVRGLGLKRIVLDDMFLMDQVREPILVLFLHLELNIIIPAKRAGACQ